jgi:putative heme iron utilization protein
MQETRKILEAVARLPENAVIVVGARWPEILAVLSDEYKDNHILVVRTDDPLEMLHGRAPVDQHHRIFTLWDHVGLHYHLLVGPIEYVALIKDADTYRRYVEQGRAVYFLRDIEPVHLKRYGVDLRHLGAQQLDALDGK